MDHILCQQCLEERTESSSPPLGLNKHCPTQVKIDGPVRARYFDGPVTGPLRAQNPLRARYNGPVTGPL